MKRPFIGILIGLAILSGVAWWLKPRAMQDGKTILTWCSDDNPARRDQVALFNRLHPQYTLRLDPGNSTLEKVIVQSKAGVGPDLFDSYAVFQSSAFIRAGIAWDVTDRLKEAGIDVTNDVWRTMHPYLMYDGRTYGFPRNVAADAVFCNRDLFERNGVPFPKERLGPEEFLALAKRLTVRDADGRIKHFGFMFSTWQWQFFMHQWGGRLYSADGTRCEADCPETVAAMQYMRDLIWKHNVSPTPDQESSMATSGGWGSGAMTWFGGGRTAMALGGRWWRCLLRNKTQYPDLRYGVVEAQFGPYRKYMGYGGGVMINRFSPRREQALEFLKYMAGREYNELINHQADGIGPVKRYADTELFLHDPDYPDEQDNQVWREVTACAEPQQTSLFINGAVTERIMSEQIDLLRNNHKSAEDAMKSAAAQINAEIGRNLQKSEALKEKYDRIRAGAGGKK